MNGSKNILLLVIFVMALLPWGFLLALLNSDNGAELLGIDAAEVTPEEIVEMRDVIARQTREIQDLQISLAAAQKGEEPLITPQDLRELRQSVEQLRRENREAEGQIDRLRTEYNSALSEVVRLKTQQMAADAAPKPAPTPAPAPEPEPVEPEQEPVEPEPEPTPAPQPDPGGWILPPSN